MRRATVALVVTAVAVVLLVNFKARPPVLSASASSGGAGARQPARGAVDTTSSSPAAPARSRRKTAPRRPATTVASAVGPAIQTRKTAPPRPATTLASAVGPAIQTQYGIVQVKATTRGGVLAEAQVVALTPDSGRSQEIESQAIPILHEEALRAHSANIDLVSGATYTSEGYISSLQAAIDRARGA